MSKSPYGCIEPHTAGCVALSRREHFAALAMQGLLAHDLFARDCSEANATEHDGRRALAIAAARYADALCEVLALPTNIEVQHVCAVGDLGAPLLTPRNETMRSCRSCGRGFFVGDILPSGATVKP